MLVCVDLGSGSLRLTVGETYSGSKIRILYCRSFPSDGVAHGKVINPGKLGAAISQAVSHAEETLGIKIEEVMTCSQKYDIRMVDKEVEDSIDAETSINESLLGAFEDSAREAVQNECNATEEVMDIVVQQYNTDDEFGMDAGSIIGMMGSRLNAKYKVFVGKTSTSKYIDNAFAAYGIRSVRKVFKPQLVGECVLTRAERETGVALIDLGAGASSVSVFYGGVLRHYGAIPFGGNSITGDICSLCGIGDTLAENLKKQYGGCIPEKLEALGEKTLRIRDVCSNEKIELTAKYLSEIITARTREIIEALLYEIQKSGYADKLKNGIVLVGGGAAGLNICNMVKLLSGYNAHIAGPSRNRFVCDADSPLILHLENEFFATTTATSAGLLLAAEATGRNFAGTFRDEPAEEVQENTVEQNAAVEEDTAEEQNAAVGQDAGEASSVAGFEAVAAETVQQEENHVQKQVAPVQQVPVNAAKQDRKDPEQGNLFDKGDIEVPRQQKPKPEKKKGLFDTFKATRDIFHGSIFNDDDDPNNQI